MPDPLLYLKAMGAAAIASAMFVLAMGRVRPSASTTWLNSACVLGIGLGLALGCDVLSLRLAWPPVNGLDRFFTIVVPAVLSIELIAGFQRVPPWAAWLLRMSLAAVVPRILLHGSVYLSGSGNDWTQWQAGTALTVCSAWLAASWGLLSWLSQRSPGVSIPFALHLSTLCAGLCVMMGGYIKGGAAAVPLAATLAATAIGARLITKRTGASANFGALAILGIGVVGLFGLLFIGLFFGRISTGSALTMLLAPLLCWTTETPLLRHRKPWLVGSLRLALVAIPLMVVLALAKSNFDRKMAPLLTWDDDNMLRVDLSGKYPMLHIPAELEKGNQDRLLPIAPEFAEFLLATPEAERPGFVFTPLPVRPERSNRLGDQQVGRVVSRIGKAAAVAVDTDRKTGKVKYASAHDLRRSFGERWAPRVMPQVLMELMRHESIETTLKNYVGRNAETTAAALYAAVSGNTLGNTADFQPTADVTENEKTPAKQRLS